jgi:hypothetical protein
MRQWKDRRRKLELPLFPGYVFVRLPFTERAKAISTPQVVCLVGGKTSPSAVSDEEIAWIKLGLEHGRAEPYQYLNVGERVVISSGALSGLEGLLLKIRNSTRVAVALDSIARAFVVEIDACCVKPASPIIRHNRPFYCCGARPQQSGHRTHPALPGQICGSSDRLDADGNLLRQPVREG